MVQRNETVSDKAQTVARSFEHHERGASQALHHDADKMSASDRKQFFHDLQKAGQGHELPGLSISTDSQNRLKVTEQSHGKTKTVYDEAAEDKKAGAAKTGQPGDAPGAATPANPPNDGFSGGLRKGEGPYQALHRQHPEMSHKQLLDAAHQIIKESGRHGFKQGEQFKINEDGSVSTRTPGKDGAFSEDTTKGGKTLEHKTGTKDGHWNSQTFDDKGNPTGSVEHTPGADGAYNETTKDASGQHVLKTVDGDKNGTLTKTFNDKGEAQSAIRQNNDGTAAGWQKNADGTQTNIDQTDANHRTDTVTRAGQTVRTITHETSADGTSKDVTVDKETGSTKTETFDKDHHKLTEDSTDKNGGTHSWKKNADGTETTIDKPDSAHTTETHKNGDTLISKTNTVKTKDGTTEETINGDGTKTSKGFDTQGRQIAGSSTDKDGKETGFNTDKDGNVEHYDKTPDGRKVASTFDKSGHLIQTEESSKESTVIKKQTAPGVVQIYTTHFKGAQMFVHPPTAEGGTLTPPHL